MISGWCSIIKVGYTLTIRTAAAATFQKNTKSIDKLRDDPFRAGLVRPGQLMTSKQAAKARGTSRRLAVC